MKADSNANPICPRCDKKGFYQRLVLGDVLVERATVSTEATHSLSGHSVLQKCHKCPACGYSKTI